MNMILRAKEIKEIREKVGLSQKELAAKLGVSQQAVHMWEQGIRFPRYQHLMKLSKLYDRHAS